MVACWIQLTSLACIGFSAARRCGQCVFERSDDSAVLHIAGDRVETTAQLCRGVGHNHRMTDSCKHGQVPFTVTDGHYIPQRDADSVAQLPDGASFVSADTGDTYEGGAGHAG